MRYLFEASELLAVSLAPLVTLAVSTVNEGTAGTWWQLVGLGFGPETIRNVQSGKPNQAAAKTNP